MTRLYFLVEGPTELEFVKRVLAPHLNAAGIWTYAQAVETSRDALGPKRRGGGRWKNWARDLGRLTSQQKGADVRFTTMFDLYGLPDDFPALTTYSMERNTVKRADQLEAAMATAVRDHRLIPYIQRHEFEALVLSALGSLAMLFDNAEDIAGVAALRRTLEGEAPEEVNDGEHSAPSKRLIAAIPSYRKTLHGPGAVAEAGLGALRTRCPRFDAWVKKLEALRRSES